jgi:hypothetical protein
VVLYSTNWYFCPIQNPYKWETAFQTSAPFSDFGLWGLILLPAIRFQS